MFNHKKKKIEQLEAEKKILIGQLHISDGKVIDLTNRAIHAEEQVQGLARENESYKKAFDAQKKKKRGKK